MVDSKKLRDTNVNWHRPVCVKCECEMRPERNGVGVVDYFNPSDKPDPQPYAVWDADLWKCPKCGIEVMVGFGANAISNHHEEKFQWHIERYQRFSQIVKCY